MVVSQVMGKAGGISMRMPLAAVMVGKPLASVTVICTVAVDGSFSVKAMLAWNEMEGAPPTAMKNGSTAQLVPRLLTSSWRLLGVDGAEKFWKASPEIVSVWLAVKSESRLTIAV